MIHIKILQWINSPIEKAPYMSRQFGQSLTPDHAPLLHFGVMPVQSNPVNAPKATFANVAMIWEIETELHTTTSIGYGFRCSAT